MPHCARTISPLIVIISTTHSSLPLFQCCCQSSSQSSASSWSCRMPVRSCRISWWRWYRCCFLRYRALHGRSGRLRLRMIVITVSVRDRWCWWRKASLLYWWRWRRCRLAGVRLEICRRSPTLLCTVLSFSKPPALISLASIPCQHDLNLPLSAFCVITTTSSFCRLSSVSVCPLKS